MRLIDADKLENILSVLEEEYKAEISQDGRTEDPFSDGILSAMFTVFGEIKKAPAVDAVPVVHAYWTPEYTETGVVAFGYKEETVESLSCSNCGMEIDVSEGDFMYCPHCCAKMDGKENKHETDRC